MTAKIVYAIKKLAESSIETRTVLAIQQCIAIIVAKTHYEAKNLQQLFAIRRLHNRRCLHLLLQKYLNANNFLPQSYQSSFCQLALL